jgi:hypothetical protein
MEMAAVPVKTAAIKQCVQVAQRASISDGDVTT